MNKCKYREMLNTERKAMGLTWRQFSKTKCGTCKGTMTNHYSNCWEFSPYPLEPEDNPFLMDGDDLVGARD